MAVTDFWFVAMNSSSPLERKEEKKEGNSGYKKEKHAGYKNKKNGDNNDDDDDFTEWDVTMDQVGWGLHMLFVFVIVPVGLICSAVAICKRL
jgi:hypothetical protein